MELRLYKQAGKLKFIKPESVSYKIKIPYNSFIMKTIINITYWNKKFSSLNTFMF